MSYISIFYPWLLRYKIQQSCSCSGFKNINYQTSPALLYLYKTVINQSMLNQLIIFICKELSTARCNSDIILTATTNKIYDRRQQHHSKINISNLPTLQQNM